MMQYFIRLLLNGLITHISNPPNFFDKTSNLPLVNTLPTYLTQVAGGDYLLSTPLVLKFI